MTTKEIFHLNILSEIIKFLDQEDLTSLMKCCRDLLYKIGKSEIWIESSQLKKYLESFKFVLPFLTSNPLIRNSFILRDYYDIYYYSNKYLQIPFKYNIFLADLMKSSKNDMKKLEYIIKYHDEVGLRYIDNTLFIFSSEIIIRNLNYLKKTFSSVPKNIIDSVLLDIDLDLNSIILNMNNDSHPLKIFSKMNYIINKNDSEKYLLIPEKEYYVGSSDEAIQEYNQYLGEECSENYLENLSETNVNNYGDNTWFRTSMYKYSIDSLEIKEYFTLLGGRLNIDPKILQPNMVFILEILSELQNYDAQKLNAKIYEHKK